MPMPAVTHISAAVVSPEIPFVERKIAPAPRKPIPVTTCDAILPGSAPPAIYEASIETIENMQLPRLISAKVRRLGSFPDISLSNPIIAPRPDAATSFISAENSDSDNILLLLHIAEFAQDYIYRDYEQIMNSNKRLIFASHNANKVREIAIAAEKFGIFVLSADDLEKNKPHLGKFEEVDETEQSYIGNARLKAIACVKWCGERSFADDSGIEIAALGGKPGVHSARYGNASSHQERNQILLDELKGRADRRARFVSVQCCIGTDFKEIATEGILNGALAEAPRGRKGWGYEPIFIPEGYQQTIAELKDQGIIIPTHRALALEKLFTCLRAS
jgi:XTP/dITP diphosphohydrolase